MTEQGIAPGLPAVHQPTQPPPLTPAPPRQRRWFWWTFGIIIVLSAVTCSCTLPLVLLMGSGDTSLTNPAKSAVAVLSLDGVIAGSGDSYSGYITPRDFVDMLDKAEKDKRVKAIVIAVDSPGGTVAASQEIASHVASATKPVIVSSGDVNASGAYMVSSQADEVWALPGTAVGSIGVIAEIPNVAGLMDNLGIEFQVITAGENKDTGSPFRPLTKKERALIQGQVDEVYDQFIDIVAEGRAMERPRVEELATGWTWSGEKALDLGLVDQIGTHRDALDSAARAGGIDGDYDIVTYDDDYGAWLRSLLRLTAAFERISAAVGGQAVPSARGVIPR